MRALAADAGVAPDLRVDSPDVILGEMEDGDGARYVWLVNMADAVVDTVPSGASLVTLDGDAVLGYAPPFGVEVLAGFRGRSRSSQAGL